MKTKSVQTLLLIMLAQTFAIPALGKERQKTSKPKHYITPTKILLPNQYPSLVDDLDLNLMEVALNRQIERFQNKPLNGTIRLGQDVYPLTQMLKSALTFRRIINTAQQCFSKIKTRQLKGHLETKLRKKCQRMTKNIIIENFNIYVPKLEDNDPGQGQEKFAFFTAYNTPTIEVSRTKTDYFRYGIYAKPSNPTHREYTRNQIDFQSKLEGTGNTLFYAHDLFELYLLHIEGGGHVIFNDSPHEQAYLSYDETNNQPFHWISTYMVEQGYLTRGNRSIEAQRVYLRQNPQREEEIYSTCQNYIYFKITETPPYGSDSVSLTDNRSIATDKRYYKAKGLISFVMARRPVENYREKKRLKKPKIEFRDFSRFYIDQDTGGAIKGKARVDLYFGEGAYSQIAGENITEWGKVFFLMQKL